jgi:hypothetical protein
MVQYAFIELSHETCTKTRQTNTHLVSVLSLDFEILDINLEKSVETYDVIQFLYLILTR